ncbi:MAG: hypothetical protein QM831_18175 [Kofleriaceae bacterium]
MKIQIALAAVLAVTGCKKHEDAKPDDKAERAKEMADVEAKAAKEKARWTPELTQQAVALRDQTAPDAKTALAAIAGGPHREPGNSARDAWRHPIETLTFLGIEPTQTVVELGGGGWYTEFLAPLLADHGKLIVVAGDPSEPHGHAADLFLAKSPELYGKVQRLAFSKTNLSFGPPASADTVLAMREMHNWERSHRLAEYLKAVHDVLKPNGVFGVEEHRAAEGKPGEATAETGYLPEAWTIEKVTAAGFKLEDKSEINANPKDTKDHPQGVWNLPPTFADGDKDKAKYQAIGESDRMTLKFRRI